MISRVRMKHEMESSGIWRKVEKGRGAGTNGYTKKEEEVGRRKKKKEEGNL